jgi:hypothetical protein
MRRAWIVDLVLWLFISRPLLMLRADWPWAGVGGRSSLIAVRAAAPEVDPRLGRRQEAAARELREGAGTATARLREIIGVLREEGGAAPTTPVNETVADAVARTRLRHDGDTARVGRRAEGACDDGPSGPPRRTGSADERQFAATPVYELCFADDRLASKAIVN